MAEGYRWIKAQVSNEDYESARKAKGDLTWDEYVRLKLVQSWVYVFERADRCVKIGYSSSPVERARALRAGQGPLALLAARPGGRKEEKAAHVRLAGSRMGDSEWFQRTSEVDAYVEELLREFGQPKLSDWGEVSSTLLQIRLTMEEKASLDAAVERANDLAESQGLPRAITMTALVRLRLRELLEGGPSSQGEPESPAERRVVSSAGIDAARAALRGKR